MTRSADSRTSRDASRLTADWLIDGGRWIALIGVILVLLLIGGLKFTQIEIDGLKPIIGGTPWLAWMYPVLGEAGASYLLGVVELATAALLALSPWSRRAGIVGGALASLTFLCDLDRDAGGPDLGSGHGRISLAQSDGAIPDQGRGAARHRPGNSR